LALTGFTTTFYNVSLDGRVEVLPGFPAHPGNSFVAGKQLPAFAGETTVKSPELWVATARGDAGQPTHFNREWGGIPLVAPEIVRYASFDGREIEAALLLNGEEDTTDPIGQCGQFYRGLGRYNVETVVTLRDACHFALDKLRLPVSDALKEVRPPDRRSYGEDTTAQAARFACPGSILRIEFNTKHPVAYGMPPEAPGMFYGGTAFDLAPSFGKETPATVGKYPAGALLMSGYLLGGSYLNGKAAALDVPVGKGRVVLLGFAVQNRAQPHGTFKLLFNSLYYGAAQLKKPGRPRVTTGPAGAFRRQNS